MRRAALYLGLMVMICGCAPRTQWSTSHCPGQTNVTAALALLQKQAAKITPLQAYGLCRLGYPDENGKLKESAAVRVTLWMEPPHDIYMQGFVGMGSQGKVEMGSNAKIFWVGVKPELDEFWWGRWDQARDRDDLQISPKAVMASLGVLEIGPPESWSLSRARGFDVLTQHSPSQHTIRRVFLDRCDYVPHRIEYFDQSGKISLVVELAHYTSLGDGFEVPQEIAISNFENGHCTHWVRLSLTTIKEKTFSDRLRRKVFHFDESKLKGYGRVTEVTRPRDDGSSHSP